MADGRCGLVSSTPVVKGQDVQIGCHVQYDWLPALRQYNPPVFINASIEFLGQPETFTIPTAPRYTAAPAPSENLDTTFTIRNVQAGQIRHTCRVRFEFERRRTYGGRNSYATNTLEWNCAVSGQYECSDGYFKLRTQPIVRSKVAYNVSNAAQILAPLLS